MASVGKTIQSVAIIVRPGTNLYQVEGEDERLQFTVHKFDSTLDPVGQRESTVAKMDFSLRDLFSPKGDPKVYQTTLRKPDGIEGCRYFLTQHGSSHSLTFVQDEIAGGAVGLTVQRDSDGTLIVDPCLLTTRQGRDEFSRVAEPKGWGCSIS